MGRFEVCVCIAVLCCGVKGYGQQRDPAFETTDDYRVEESHGWTLRISSDFGPDEAELLRKVRRELDRQFTAIEAAVPAAAVEKLRQIEIWVEVNDPLFPCMCYHGHGRWLRAHGVNPDKTDQVELANARNFLSWTRHQPWMVLHELAHGYHDRFLPHGFQNEDVAAALAAALEGGLYGEVKHIGGGTRKHYASTNPMEFFAESTEAFFGKNDFYPYNHKELVEYDPAAALLLARLWGARSGERPVAAPRPEEVVGRE